METAGVPEPSSKSPEAPTEASEAAAAGSAQDAAPPVPPERDPRPLAIWFVAAAVGLIAGGFAAFLLLYWLGSQEPLRSAVKQLEQRVSTLQQTIEERSGGLEERIARIETDLSKRFEQTASVEKETAARLGALERHLNRLSEALAETKSQLARVAQPPSDMASAAALNRLRERLDELEAALASLREQRTASSSGNADLRQALRKAEEERAALRTELAELRSSLKSGLGRRDGALKSLENRVTSVAERLDRLEQEIAELRTAVRTLRSARARAVALSLVANQLGLALLRGGDLAEPVADLETLADDDPELGEILRTLAPYRNQRILSLAELRRRFEELAPRMREGGAESGDLLSRTRRNLERLVRIRRAGEPSSAAETAVDAAERALAVGDLEGAVKALAPLAEQGNAAARKWLALAEARKAAQTAATKLAEHARQLLLEAGSRNRS